MNFPLNLKGILTNSRSVRYVLCSIVLILCMPILGFAQERPIKNPARPLGEPADTTQVQQPEGNELTPEGIASDTIPSADTIPQPKGDIETTIFYSARDSIRASMKNKLIWLYGDANIRYGEIELQAEEIVIDYANNTITAQGVRDSLGNRIGYPVFKNGSEVYETKGIIYNFKTRRARIVEVLTKQGDGILASKAAFKNERNEILSINNSYTTCDLEDPHFRIIATKSKAIPNDKIVAGPFYVEFNDIPLPAGFLFGMFPAERESKSGILFPSYGEERRRGFNLRNGGYFFDISPYMKLTLTGDIYSKGGHALNSNIVYKKRYKYDGNFRFSYSRNRLGNQIEKKDISNDFRLTWSHSPQTKGTGRFAASVNAATTTYNQINNLMSGTPGELYSSGLNNITTKLSSNVSYSKRFAGTPFSAGVNLSHNQDLTTGLVDLPLPNVTVNMTNIYPFQRKGVTGPLDNFSVGYSMAATNRITNNLGRLTPGATRDSIAPFDFQNLPLFFENARKGVRHTLPVSYSFKFLKFFTMSPSVNYEEKWYFERLSWRYDRVLNRPVVADTINGFNRIGNYSFSTGLNTRIYGMYFFKNPNSSIKAIRHVINPNISFSYAPDFTTNRNYFDELVDNAGRTVYQDKFQGFVYGGSSRGRMGAIGFSLGNNVEMKVKTAKDTVERKVMLLNNLSIAANYNLLADSFKLSTVRLSANTNILDNTINVNMSATLDPYHVATIRNPETGVETERRVNSLAWTSARRLGRITTATVALSTNLNPRKRAQENSTREKVAKSNIPEHEKEYIMQNADMYVDFDIPWSLNVGYSLSYSHNVGRDANIVQSLQMSGDVSVSQNWKITFNSGYHFERKEFTQTNVGISRDLHCWTMRLNWVPFGRFQSYNFTIAVKSAILKDLKLERRRPFLDNL